MVRKSITEYLESGERARLIPVVSPRQKEVAAVSVVLAVFRIIPEYAKMMLEEVGAPWSKLSTLAALTEVCFKKPKHLRSQLPRPDGMLIVDTSRKEWTALVEAKIKNEQLKSEQLEKYLDLAKEFGIDALITISNQFATTPSHHPASVDKRKLKSVNLYHFSWLSLLSNAQLLSESDTVTDREQAMVLKELIRYLEHDHSGVQLFDRMGPSWKDICTKIHNAETIGKSDTDLQASISDWSQLIRYLSLTLSTKIGKSVALTLSRKHRSDPEAKYTSMIDRYRLADSFSIPNTAGQIHLEADFRRRTISVSMQVDPPADKKRPTAAINWLTRQLKDDKIKDVLITCHWPRKTPSTTKTLEQAQEYPEDLVPENCNDHPTKLEVRRVVSLAGRFRGARTVVEDCEQQFVTFYRDIGQNVTPWTPSPPKYKKEQQSLDETDLECSIEQDPATVNK
jgi:hypothetical protein